MKNQRKKVLYIAEDYFTSKVHHSLCEELGKKWVDVTLFAVERESNQNRRLKELPHSDFYQLITSKIEGSQFWYKYNFNYKIKMKYALLQEYILNKEYDMSYAATLFSEGAIAYQLYRERNIPYVVAVRSTDYFFYFLKMFHLWQLGKDILEHAQKIIFITPSLYKSVLMLPQLKSMQKEIVAKAEIIPNGLDPFWRENICNAEITTPTKLLYVGNFAECKNLPRLIKAVAAIKNSNPELTLTLIGDGGDQEKKVKKSAKRYEWISTPGRVNDRNELLRIYREHHLFVMPSFETFGLVYLEALTQGLPLIYAQNSGFDGIYPDGKIGYAVKLHEQNDISRKIELLLQNYSKFKDNIRQLSFDQYDWKIIAERFAAIFLSTPDYLLQNSVSTP